MYEDTAIELGAFPPGSRVLCIASGGCTALALAPRHEVVAIDINPAQLAYAERRFAGAPAIAGAAERVLSLGRSIAPLLGWAPHRMLEFLELSDPDSQTAYWQRHLDTLRFRTSFDGLLSITSLRTIYAMPFLEFLPRRLGMVLRARMARCFASHSNRDNPYARALLLGSFASAAVPAEAQAIRTVHADAADFLEHQPAGSFDGFALSNILDGAATNYRDRLFAAVRRAASPDAMTILRSFREPEAPTPTNRAADDRSMLWGIVDVRRAADLI
jgi:S-adenosylmethionine:diacylglycerol 3-amino-3-carboxypropyl transferase